METRSTCSACTARPTRSLGAAFTSQGHIAHIETFFFFLFGSDSPVLTVQLHNYNFMRPTCGCFRPPRIRFEKIVSQQQSDIRESLESVMLKYRLSLFLSLEAERDSFTVNCDRCRRKWMFLIETSQEIRF